jgi:hypothetical protein
LESLALSEIDDDDSDVDDDDGFEMASGMRQHAKVEQED